MSDKYRIVPRGDFNDIWAFVDDVPVENLGEADVRVLAELNYLAQLVDQSVNQAHLTNRTHVRHAFADENLDKKTIDALQEHRPPASDDGYPCFTVDILPWNKMVRTLKALAERFLLP